ncbi:MAG TPA: 4-(cytidine 5'-diphospho)-2-C-methyl-D-erythritol kinase [Xanthobacteraceae bacterium]|nr:4-(cytidine 5'-diphospho)-2-C-methyl-D-erythritol kinase [Xanthobacteraceae bacterium]
MAHLAERAHAKVNLTLRVLGRRPDGYHELESLVAFAEAADELVLLPGEPLSLDVEGPTAGFTGEPDQNLVLKAARALAARAENLVLGRFRLTKRLPVAAGLGGGSADAAAALRLLARVNSIARNDPRLIDAARATGADVPVCLDPRARVMRGVGEILSAPLDLPDTFALLVNPGVEVSTREVFAALRAPVVPAGVAAAAAPAFASRSDFFEWLARDGNDLEAAAVAIAPAVAEVLDVLRVLPGVRLARMSGSGATCFALFETREAAATAAGQLADARPAWWTRATRLGSG